MNIRDFFKVSYPPTALFISPSTLAGVKLGEEREELTGYFIKPLKEELIASDENRGEIFNQSRLAELIEESVEKLSPGDERLSIVLPDILTHCSILDPDEIPSDREDILDLIRWKMQNQISGDLDRMKIEYQILSDEPGNRRIFTVIVDRELIEGYEEIFDILDLHLGLVETTSQSLLNLSAGLEGGNQDGVCHIMCYDSYFRVFFADRGDLVFVRSKHQRSQKTDYRTFLRKEIKNSSLFYEEKLSGSPVKECYINVFDLGYSSLSPAVEGIFGIEPRSYDFRNLISVDSRMNISEESIPLLAPCVGTALKGENR